jgi:hypothetical protein
VQNQCAKQLAARNHRSGAQKNSLPRGSTKSGAQKKTACRFVARKSVEEGGGEAPRSNSATKLVRQAVGYYRNEYRKGSENSQHVVIDKMNIFRFFLDKKVEK